MTPIEQKIESVVDNILLDYQNNRDIDRLELYRHPDKDVIIDMIGKLICLVFFLTFPTTNVRPEVNGTGLTPFLMKAVYTLDTPTNLFPSIHCFIAWLGSRYIFTSRNLKKKRLHCAIALLGSLLVFASTLYTKQHVIWDVFGAVIVAEIAIFLSHILPIPTMITKWNRKFMTTSLCKFL